MIASRGYDTNKLTPQENERLVSEMWSIYEIEKGNQAIIKNLAVLIAPRFGKQISPNTQLSAKLAYNNLLVNLATPQRMTLPTNLPVGQGNKPWMRPNSSPYVTKPAQTIDDADNGEIEFQ